MAVCIIAVWSIIVPATRAQGVTDPGDLAFWDAIKNSTNPAEYSAYLQTYPNGRFADLARIRGGNTGPTLTPPAPEASDYTIAITPTAGRVGDTFIVGCGNIPFGNSSYDKLVIVPAGTPVMDPTVGREQSKVVWSVYANQCSGPLYKAGPFAPGAYEVRWMTILMNNETRYEMKAKAAFTIR